MYKIKGEKIRQIREQSGLTQEGFAVIIGKHKKDIGHYENNRATPPANSLITFLIEFDVNPKEIAEKV